MKRNLLIVFIFLGASQVFSQGNNIGFSVSTAKFQFDRAEVYERCLGFCFPEFLVDLEYGYNANLNYAISLNKNWEFMIGAGATYFSFTRTNILTSDFNHPEYKSKHSSSLYQANLGYRNYFISREKFKVFLEGRMLFVSNKSFYNNDFNFGLRPSIGIKEKLNDKVDFEISLGYEKYLIDIVLTPYEGFVHSIEPFEEAKLQNIEMRFGVTGKF